MVFKIYQDREKISDTENADNDYHVLFPQTVPEAIIYKNDFTNENNLKSVIEYILENKSCVVVSEDEPTDTVGDTHWMKIIGTYNNGTIGNVYLFYTLKHILRNHDDTNNIKSENIICKANVEIIPPMKEYPGYLAETPEKVIITENGQIVECYYDEQQYTISYVLNGGINSNDNPANIYYTEEFTLKNPTKEHYNFNGWYTDNGFKKKISKLSKIADNTTLYAKFTEMFPDTISNLSIKSGNNSVTITYSHPTEYYGGTTLVYKEGNIPTSISDGTVVEKFLSGTTINNLTNGTTYGFSLFNHNQIGNYKGDYLGDTATPTSSSSGGGETDTKVYLYKNGDECTSITGGWYTEGSDTSTCTKKDTYIEIKTGGRTSFYSSYNYVYTVDGKSIGKHKKMCIKYSSSGGVSFGGFCRYNGSGSPTINGNIFSTGLPEKTYVFVDDDKWTIETVANFGVYLETENIGRNDNQYIIPESTFRIYEIWVE